MLPHSWRILQSKCIEDFQAHPCAVHDSIEVNDTTGIAVQNQLFLFDDRELVLTHTRVTDFGEQISELKILQRDLRVDEQAGGKPVF